ncbi:MAG: phage tail tip lysozyme [Eubacteriales bacterium]|nr:phage tail tip lysozyme [Eubacteriales bacterium]
MSFCINGCVHAWAENKADYLTSALTYFPSGFSQRKQIIDCLKNEAVNSEKELISDPEDIKEIISHSSESAKKGAFGFITEAAYAQNAVYAGTFLDSDSCSEQYRFLTEVNGFTEHRSDQCLLPGDSLLNIYSGDIIFWLNESKTPVTAGLVCECHHSYAEVAICEENNILLAKFSRNIMESLGDFTVVHPEYAFNEQLIYLYCVNTLQYTRTGACGVVANVHFESSSVAAKEEYETEIGYGICQWSFDRRDKLEQYCVSKGLDVSLLESQLEFMGYELENDFKFTGDFLRSAPETDSGAYDSGYWFCFEYEQPFDFETVSEERAKLSLDLWKKMF